MKWNLFKWGVNDPVTGKFIPSKRAYGAVVVFVSLFIFGLFKSCDAHGAELAAEVTVGSSWNNGDKVGSIGETVKATLLIDDAWQISLGYATDQEFKTKPPIDEYIYITVDRRVYLDSDRKIAPWVGLGFAILPTVKVDENWRLPLPIEFHLQAGVKVNRCLSEKTACVFGWDHISNAGLRRPNVGENFFSLGLQYKF